MKRHLRRNLVAVGVGACAAIGLILWIGNPRPGALEVNSGVPFTWVAYEPGHVVGFLSWGVAGNSFDGTLTTSSRTRSGRVISPPASWFSGYRSLAGRFRITIEPLRATGTGFQNLHEIQLTLTHYPGGPQTLTFRPGTPTTYNLDHEALLANRR